MASLSYPVRRYRIDDDVTIDKRIGRAYVEYFEKHGEPTVCYVPAGVAAPATFGPLTVRVDRQLQQHEIDLGVETQSAPQPELRSALVDTTQSS